MSKETRIASAFLVALLPTFLGGPVVAQSLSGLHRISDGVTSCHSEFRHVNIPKGGKFELADLKGPGKVTYFYITDDNLTDQNRLYPGLVLQAFWDDETEASIQVPLADFFGVVGKKMVDYQSAVMAINHGCFMCYLPMPFSTHARRVLANDGDRDYSRKVAYGVDYEADPAYAGERSRLHAQWRRSKRMRTNTPAWPSGTRRNLTGRSCSLLSWSGRPRAWQVPRSSG